MLHIKTPINNTVNLDYEYTLINIRERIKGFLKKFKKFPKLYAKILHLAVTLSKLKRIFIICGVFMINFS